MKYTILPLYVRQYAPVAPCGPEATWMKGSTWTVSHTSPAVDNAGAISKLASAMQVTIDQKYLRHPDGAGRIGRLGKRTLGSYGGKE